MRSCAYVDGLSNKITYVLEIYLQFTMFSRWSRTTRCLTRIVVYTDVDAQCNKLAMIVVGRTIS